MKNVFLNSTFFEIQYKRLGDIYDLIERNFLKQQVEMIWF